MKEFQVDVAVIGGGPAGLAAALEARKQGIEKVLLLERDNSLGGILQQCIHDGFGLHRFNARLSGGQYAQRFIDQLDGSGIEVKLDTIVIDMTDQKVIYACNPTDGMMRIQCGAIILAMGCRERTASQVLIYGTRPAGVMTAGAAQRYINMEGYLPGKNAVILGSGDIGLIMARRMTLEGINVKGVYEVMPNPGGLTRNIVQCLDDYGIPLHLSTTVTRIEGKKRVERVTVAKVDEKRNVIPGTEEVIDCDLLVLAVGLIPENELSRQAHLEMDRKTRAPLLDNNFMTSCPGIFAAGNVSVVFDLVDYVSLSGEIAARGAAKYLAGKLPENPQYRTVTHSDRINFIVPQRVEMSADDDLTFFMRVTAPCKNARLVGKCGDNVICNKRHQAMVPPEMLECTVKVEPQQEIYFSVEEG